MYATSEWECDCVDRNMVQSVGTCYKQRKTNLRKTNFIGGTGIVKLNVNRDRECETNNCQNRPWDLHQAYLAHGLILAL
jgi:hypothetical protein